MGIVGGKPAQNENRRQNSRQSNSWFYAENIAGFTSFSDEMTDVNPIARLDNWISIDPIEEHIIDF